MTAKKPPPAKAANSAVTDDEASLWHFIAGSVKPLKKPKGRVHATARLDDLPIPRAPAAASQPTQPAQRSKPAADRPPLPAPPPKIAPPQLADFDRKKARKIRTGQIEIEARIDLHGMRQHEAHDALRAFLTSCHRRDQRWVLVITGKGGPARSSKVDDLDHFGESNRRGVLRQNVPRWLSEPDLRAIVVSFTTAAIQHGGEGALYIHLRSSKR